MRRPEMIKLRLLLELAHEGRKLGTGQPTTKKLRPKLLPADDARCNRQSALGNWALAIA